MVWEQHCASLWSPEKAWSRISSMAEVDLLLALCNQCVSVVTSEVKVRSYNFRWSVAHQKPLILIE